MDDTVVLQITGFAKDVVFFLIQFRVVVLFFFMLFMLFFVVVEEGKINPKITQNASRFHLVSTTTRPLERKRTTTTEEEKENRTGWRAGCAGWVGCVGRGITVFKIL